MKFKEYCLEKEKKNEKQLLLYNPYMQINGNIKDIPAELNVTVAFAYYEILPNALYFQIHLLYMIFQIFCYKKAVALCCHLFLKYILKF
jgi:hypothetical protein